MTPIKDQTNSIMQILGDPETHKTGIDALQKGGTLIKHVLHLLWLSLCAIYVMLAWLVQQGHTAQAAYWDWYQQTAPQENFAGEFAKAAWRLLARNAISLHTYAKQYLDQYQGPQPDEPTGEAEIAASPTSQLTAATSPATSVSFIRASQPAS